MGWIQKANKSIKERGTEGVCTGAKFGSSSCPPGSKRYNLAVTFKKMAKNRAHGHAEGSIMIQQQPPLYGSTFVNPLSDVKYQQPTQSQMPKFGEGSRVARLAKKQTKAENQATELQQRADKTRTFGSQRASDFLNNAISASHRGGLSSAEYTTAQKEDLIAGSKFGKQYAKLKKKTENRALNAEAMSKQYREEAARLGDKRVLATGTLHGINKAVKGNNQQQQPSQQKSSQQKVDPNTLNANGTVKAPQQQVPQGDSKVNYMTSQGQATLDYSGAKKTIQQGGQTMTLPDNVVRGRNTQPLAETGIPRIFAQNIKLRKGKIKPLTFGADTEATKTVDQQVQTQQPGANISTDVDQQIQPDAAGQTQTDPNQQANQQTDPNQTQNAPQQNDPANPYASIYNKDQFPIFEEYLKNSGISMSDLQFAQKKKYGWTPLKDSPYKDMVYRASQATNVHPELIYSMMWRESGFNPQVISRAGALGLMQLMPATAKEVGVTNPFDPEQNILGGAKYLAQLNKKYSKLDDAVAAYNYGPGNMDKYLAGEQGIPDETRKYAQRVMNTYLYGITGNDVKTYDDQFSPRGPVVSDTIPRTLPIAPETILPQITWNYPETDIFGNPIGTKTVTQKFANGSIPKFRLKKK